MTVPTTPVTSYNDNTSADTTISNIPLLKKNGTFDGRLTGDTATTVGPDGYDNFVIDIAGGTHDSSASLTSSDTLTISYTLDSAGSVDIEEEPLDYSNLNNGFGPDSNLRSHIVSGTGTLTIPASHWSTVVPGDYAFYIMISASTPNGGIGYRGTYHLTLSTGGTTPPPPPGPSDNGNGSLVSTGNGHSYQYISFNGAAHTWDEANAMATAMGGYLVTITSQAENNFITNNVIPGHLTAGLSGAFIGSTDAGHEGTWVWATGPEAGTAFSSGPGSINGQYTNWAAGEPNGGTAENYGLIGADGQWLDVAALRNSAFTTGFIIEYTTRAAGTTADMILRSSTNGAFEIYNLGRNAILTAVQLGQVGLDWQFSSIGNFSGRGENDMLLRNSNTGGLEVYDIANNQLTGAAFIGNVGVDWQFSGVGNFSGVPGETDLILRNNRTGGLELYDINNNQLTGAAFIGTVGLDWQYAGIAPIHAPGASDLVLRNVNSGAFEVYAIANDQLVGAASLGAVGLDWQLGGFAADPPNGSVGSLDGQASSNAQLVQAMAGFDGGSGAGESLNTGTVSAETSQQTLLTTPQHG
jgi:Lectin C-type domain